MEETIKDGAKKVYEIGYLLVSSVPPEKVGDVVTTLKDVLSKKKAEIIAEEAPELMTLAYTMTKKIGTVHHRFDQAYFGWVKIEVSGSEIEEIKKAFEMHADMLRMLVMSTIRENTYLGKKAIAAPTLVNSLNQPEGEIAGTEIPSEDAKVAKASGEIDKSIDEMVKEA
jgi:ribosomal protein S6